MPLPENEFHSVWSQWCHSVTVEAFNCGHFLAKEIPDACTDEIDKLISRVERR